MTVVKVPKGSRSIYVSERKPCDNTLAIKVDGAEKKCLNDDK